MRCLNIDIATVKMAVAMEKVKKCRGSNWPEDQKYIARDMLIKHYSVLYDCFSSKVDREKKGRIWDKIHTAINSVGGPPKTLQQVKDHLKNMKLTSQKNVRGYSRYVKETGTCILQYLCITYLHELIKCHTYPYST